MIEIFKIFTFGGLTLWQKKNKDVPPAIINSLVNDVFIDKKKSSSASDLNIYHKDQYILQWKISEELSLNFVVVYQSLLQLPYIEELIEAMKSVFISFYGDLIKERQTEGRSLEIQVDFSKFEAVFDMKLAELENKYSNNGSNNNRDTIADSNIPSVKNEEGGSLLSSSSDSEETASGVSTPLGDAPNKRRVRRSKKTKSSTPVAPVATLDKKKPVKQMRKWNDDGTINDAGDSTALDYAASRNQSTDSLKSPNSNSDNTNMDFEVGDINNWGKSDKSGNFILSELSAEVDNIINENKLKKNEEETTKKSAFDFFKNIVGGKTINRADLTVALAAMKDHLLKKNVANEAADHLCKTVEEALLGTRTNNWTSVQATVQTTMHSALRRILTPTTSVDLLHEVKNARATRKRPYVISVVGVNGVGKSTNLSKIGFWLLQNKYRLLIAACDTFRSGAVEQLGVHVNRLQELTNRMGGGDVELFDKGYGGDAAVIAQKAVQYAESNGFDVVLIDTAGRRHNDKRLMSPLEKFAKLAQPDKIIMVGEALVGTDSVQQARNFNSALGNNRDLDFFLISKCDTVGDMVGTLVNMTYATNIPVLFVGTGQHYTDLKTMNIDWAVNLLMG